MNRVGTCWFYLGFIVIIIVNIIHLNIIFNIVLTIGSFEKNAKIKLSTENEIQLETI